MSEESDQQSTDEDHEAPTFAHEDELREEANNGALGGADLEHCQRMRG